MTGASTTVHFYHGKAENATERVAQAVCDHVSFGNFRIVYQRVAKHVIAGCNFLTTTFCSRVTANVSHDHRRFLALRVERRRVTKYVSNREHVLACNFIGHRVSTNVSANLWLLTISLLCVGIAANVSFELGAATLRHETFGVATNVHLGARISLYFRSFKGECVAKDRHNGAASEKYVCVCPTAILALSTNAILVVGPRFAF